MSTPENHSDTAATTRRSPALSLRDRLTLGLLRLLSRLSLGTLQTLGFILGWLASWFPHGPAWVVRRNLQLAFPEQSGEWLDRQTRQNLINTAQTGLEFTKTWGMPPEYSIAQIRAVENLPLLQEAIASGKGVIAIVPHYGNWEFMNAWLAQFAPTVIMYKPGKNHAIDHFVLEARSRLNSTLVPTDERGVKALFKHLKKGGVTAILPDHVPHDNGGIYAPFFGISVWSGVLTSRLLQKTGCRAVLLGCTRRPGGDGFTVHVGAVDDEVYSEDLHTAVSALNHSMERLIRRDPAQYQWTYKRFKKSETLQNVYQ